MPTWEDVWEDLPNDVKLKLVPPAKRGTETVETASLCEDKLSPVEKKVFALIKPDESTHIDELVERLEPEVSSPEIFAALFELGSRARSGSSRARILFDASGC